MRARALLAAAAAALALAGCGDDQEEEFGGEESITDLTISEVVERPPVPGETVGLVGEAVPLVDPGEVPPEQIGFILAGDEAAIFVLAEEEQALGEVEPGERTAIVGDVERIDQELSNVLANAIVSEDAEPEVRTLAEARVRTDAGSPYVELERVGRGPPQEEAG